MPALVIGATVAAIFWPAYPALIRWVQRELMIRRAVRDIDLQWRLLDHERAQR